MKVCSEVALYVIFIAKEEKCLEVHQKSRRNIHLPMEESSMQKDEFLPYSNHIPCAPIRKENATLDFPVRLIPAKQTNINNGF